MNIGIVVLVLLGVMIFSQVIMLANASRRRYEEIIQRLQRLERSLGVRNVD